MLSRYYITGSKSALRIGCKGSPSGSYTTVQNWISEQSKDAIECPQNADVVTFFDNNQVIININFSCNKLIFTYNSICTVNVKDFGANNWIKIISLTLVMSNEIQLVK